MLELSHLRSRFEENEVLGIVAIEYASFLSINLEWASLADRISKDVGENAGKHLRNEKALVKYFRCIISFWRSESKRTAALESRRT